MSHTPEELQVIFDKFFKSKREVVADSKTEDKKVFVIKTVTLYFNDGDVVYYSLGEENVSKISLDSNGMIAVEFNDGEILLYNGIPYSLKGSMKFNTM